MNYQYPEQSNYPEIYNNKFMYVNQQLVGNIQKNQSKVLINPNFMQVTHVRPHFNKHFLKNQTIHVNPQMLKQSDSEQIQKLKMVEPHEVRVPNKVILSTPNKLVRVPQTTLDNKDNILVSTRTKLVRGPKQKPENTRVTRTPVHTKYKIVRRPGSVTNDQKKDANIKKLYYVKNQFRIDHRSPIKNSISSHKLSRKSLILNRTLNTTLKTKNVYVKYNSKLNKTQYVSINGILYRRSSKSLINMNENAKNKAKKKMGKEQLLTIRGQKYKLDANHRTLTLLPRDDANVTSAFKTIYVGGVAFKRKQPNVFVKTNINQKRILLSQVKQKSIQTLTNKMRKSNIPCPFYRKFGKCKGKENGTCIRIHNPDQVSLCPKFLQGACVNDKCLLSHKVSAEKMPTCKFFLDGLCSKDDCPYLHVKINGKADICKDFLEGFCKKAAECDKRHQYLCADFEKTGNCTKRKCQYPHGNMVRKYKFSKIASKLQNKCNKNVGALHIKDKNHPVSVEENIKLKDSLEVDKNNLERALNVRYYDGSVPVNKTMLEAGKTCGDFEIVDLDIEQNNFDCITTLKKRPDIGTLPSFIPLFDDEQI